MQTEDLEKLRAVKVPELKLTDSSVSIDYAMLCLMFRQGVENLIVENDKWAVEKKAQAEGKAIQYKWKYEDRWTDIPDPAFNETEGLSCRIKPEPEWIPLTADDAPPGSVFRYEGWPSGCYWTPTAVAGEGPIFFNLREPEQPLWQRMAESPWEILRPGSTEWTKCRKEKA